MSFDYPFKDIRLDLTGHYVLIQNGQEIKRYITIFTCFATRAVHAVVTKDNTTVSFIHSFRRHIYRYGAPRSVLSDNAQNFVSAQNILINHSKNEAVKQILRTSHTEWRFTPSYSPWAGRYLRALSK